MIVLLLVTGCKDAPIIEDVHESRVLDTPVESVVKEADCGSNGSAQELSSALVGRWEGTIYGAYHTAEVAMDFGEDGSFYYSHPADPYGDGPFEGGTSFDVLSPSLVLVHGEAYGGDPAQVSLRSLFLTEDCVLTFNTQGYTLFQDGIESAYALRRQP